MSRSSVVLGAGLHALRLDALDEGDADPRGQHRVLAVGLEGAPAHGNAGDVDGGSERDVVIGGAALGADDRAVRARVLGLPGGGQGDGRGKHGCRSPVHVALVDSHAGGAVGHLDGGQPEAFERAGVEAVVPVHLARDVGDLLVDGHLAE